MPRKLIIKIKPFKEIDKKCFFELIFYGNNLMFFLNIHFIYRLIRLNINESRAEAEEK